MELKWMNKAENYDMVDSKIIMTAGKDTNLFNSPSGYFKCSNFPFLNTEYEGDFIVSCRVSPQFNSVYDLGCLVVWKDENSWIKFAYEYTDNGYPAIVSIRTEDYSDDCNGAAISGSCWLQISRKDDIFALHYSLDKTNWSLARIFRAAMGSRVKVGISAQCPSGNRCMVEFDEFEIREYDFENQRLAK